MKKWPIILLLVIPIIAISIVSAHVYYQANIWRYEGEDKIFSVVPGDTLPSINYRLYKEGLISDMKVFHRYIKFIDSSNSFKVGDYIIKTESNMIDVTENLLYGHSLAEKVIIPEGKNLYEIAELLELNNITNAKSFIKFAKDNLLVKKLGIKGKTLEGYLFPDTYQFAKNIPAQQVIKILVKNFFKQIKKVEINKSSLKLKQIITLASIVEKETGAGYERPIIAGVFFNRLKKGIRLQSDPTTIYGIWETFNGNLRKKHLREKTPYNTYKISGLPIGPICNPGLNAIKAVLKPAKHEHLYFVSKNDGTHVFSNTYKEHRKAVEHFQKNYHNRKNKSWRDLNKGKK